MFMFFNNRVVILQLLNFPKMTSKEIPLPPPPQNCVLTTNRGDFLEREEGLAVVPLVSHRHPSREISLATDDINPAISCVLKEKDVHQWKPFGFLMVTLPHILRYLRPIGCQGSVFLPPTLVKKNINLNPLCKEN